MGACASKPKSRDYDPQMEQTQVCTDPSELSLEEDVFLRKRPGSSRSLSILFKEEEEEESKQFANQEIQQKDFIQQSKVSKPSADGIVAGKQESSTTKVQPLQCKVQSFVLEDNVKLEASPACVQKSVEAPTKPSTCTVDSNISCTNEISEIGTGEDLSLPAATMALQSVEHGGVDLVKDGSGVGGGIIGDPHGNQVKTVEHGIDKEIGSGIDTLNPGIRPSVDADHASNTVEDKDLDATKPTKGISDVGDGLENSPKPEMKAPILVGSEDKDLGAMVLAGENYVVDNNGKTSVNPGFKVPTVGLEQSPLDIEDRDLGEASSRTENIDPITNEGLHGNSHLVKTETFSGSKNASGIDQTSSITSAAVPVSSDVAESASPGRELDAESKTEGLTKMKWVGEGEMSTESEELERVDAQAAEQVVRCQALVPDHSVKEVATGTRDLDDNGSLQNNIDYSTEMHPEELSQNSQLPVVESAVEESRATTSTNFTEENKFEVPIMEVVEGAPDNHVDAKEEPESGVVEVDCGPRDTSPETSRNQGSVEMNLEGAES